MGAIVSILEFFVTYGPTLGLLALAIWLGSVVLDEDKAAYWRGRVFKLVHKLSGRIEDEKRFISNDIKGRINLARRELNYANRVLPNAIDVEWVDGQDPEAYDIEDGEFIVRLDPSDSQARNIVYLAESVVRRTNIVGARHVVPGELQRSLDLHLARKVLQETGHGPSLDVFHKEAYEPALGSSPEFDSWNEQVIAIDERGLYERLLLVELEEFARNVAGQAPRPFMVGEVEDLVEYVHALATKDVREDVPLRLVKGYISVAVGLVSKGLKIVDRGADFYLDRTEETISRSGIDVLYVIIWGKPNLRINNAKKWREFRRESDRLIQETKELSGVRFSFSAKYEYTGPRGQRQDGEIHRFLVNE